MPGRTDTSHLGGVLELGDTQGRKTFLVGMPGGEPKERRFTGARKGTPGGWAAQVSFPALPLDKQSSSPSTSFSLSEPGAAGLLLHRLLLMVNSDAGEEVSRTVPQMQKVLDSDSVHPGQMFKRKKTSVLFMKYQPSQWAWSTRRKKKKKLREGPEWHAKKTQDFFPYADTDSKCGLDM